MKTTKTIWAPGLNHLHRPRNMNRKMVLTLWLVTTALLTAWLLFMIFGRTFGGWIHLLLVAMAVMAAVTLAYGWKHDEYYERPIRPRKKRRWKLRQSDLNPSESVSASTEEQK